MSRRLTGFLLRPITPTYYIAKERCWQIVGQGHPRHFERTQVTSPRADNRLRRNI
jgi:hypothetical protein